jgi:chemotaxis signal transduction protein
VNDGRASAAVSVLRRAFDAQFAAPPPEATGVSETLVAVRVAGDPYAVRVQEIGGITASRRIVPVPSRLPEALGLVGIRGELVPVLSLAALLGYDHAGEEPRWLILCGAEEPVGLAVAELEGQLQVAAGDLHGAGEAGAERQHIGDVVCVGSLARPVISIPSVVEAIRRRAGREGPEKER